MRKLALNLFALAGGIILLNSCANENSSPAGDDRDSFTGSWTCSEKSKLNGQTAFVVGISKVGSNDSVAITNFYDLGASISAIALISGNSITIPYQNISGGILVQGSGIKSSDTKINLTYFATISPEKDTVTASYSK